ncbi:MAG: hypothetical protein LBT33_02120 [Spirochaetia bacterium]|jgi:hypothetical protein|nr:hypothetical protein [Spirochaetia bacterium]
MKKSIFGIVCALCVLGSAVLHAQDGAPAAEGNLAMEPFVSRLKAGVKGPQIKLTWQDSRDESVQYAVYRHTREITPENFRAATLVVHVPKGQEMYVDAPPTPGEYFYAVLAVDPGGKLHGVFIPFRNKTTAGIVIEYTMAEDGLAAHISQLQAAVEGKDIVITFAASRADRGLMLFRSTSPILYPSQLLSTREARRIKSGENRVLDYPVAGIPYYYALVDEDLLTSGNSESIKLVPGDNTTTQPAKVVLKEESPALATGPASAPDPGLAAQPRGRPLPLPYFILDSKISAEESLQLPAPASIPDYRGLSLAAEKAVLDILSRVEPVPAAAATPVLLEQDKTRGLRKEDYTLQTILRGAFAEKNWKETEKLLNHYLDMPITNDARSRAYFYRGQALFFQQRHEEGFMDFLMALDKHYTAVDPWLSKILETMKSAAAQAGG